MALRLELISPAVLPLRAALLPIAPVLSRQEADRAAGERALVERPLSTRSGPS